MSIVIVDELPMARRALRLLLDSEPQFTVAGEATSGRPAQVVVAEHRPDIVVFSMHRDSDIAAVHGILAGFPESRVILLGTANQARTAGELIAAGVRGYLLNRVKSGELVAAIRTISADDERIVMSVPRRAVPALGPARPDGLSTRERDVLNLVAAAMSNAQIARHLEIAEATVKRHLHNIYRKLGAASRLDALNRASSGGLIDPAQIPFARTPTGGLGY